MKSLFIATMTNYEGSKGTVSVNRVLIATAVALLSLVVGVAPAGAVLKRPLLHQFGPDGTAATEFTAPHKVAFDQTLKRLYVLDATTNSATRRIHGFDVSTPGTFTPLAGNFPLTPENGGTQEPDLDVNGTTGNIYFASETTDTVYAYDSSGVPLGGNFPLTVAGPKNFCGVEVDPAGNIWIGDDAADILRKFDPTGAPLASENLAHGMGNVCHVSFDSTGDLFVTIRNGALHKLTAASGYTSSLLIDSEGSSRDVTVNRTTHAFVRVISAFASMREFNPDGSVFREFGTFADNFGPTFSFFRGAIFDEANDELYVAQTEIPRRIQVYGPRRILPTIETGDAVATTRTAATVAGKVELDGGPEVTECFVQYGVGQFMTTSPGTAPCSPTTPYADPTTDVTAVLSPLNVQTPYNYRIVARSANGTHVGAISTVTTQNAVKDVTTADATDVSLTGATLNGALDPDGIATTYYFQYGLTTSYGSFAPVPPPGAAAGTDAGSVPFSANLTALQEGRTYNYRLVGVNAHGTTFGPNRTFITSDRPSIIDDAVGQVNTDGAVLRARIDPNGMSTTYHYEYGEEPCSLILCEESEPQTLPAGIVPGETSLQVTGLEAGKLYYFRVVAANARGETIGDDRKLITYVPDPGNDPCSNSIVRQQTGASLLADCRAYELVSAADGGGYDVESALIPGQLPLAAHPQADDRLSYSVHSGSIPGIAGNPTNFDRDPYVATRGPDGWTTEYVGLPAHGMAQSGPFGSPLLEANDALTVFAFGGPNICAPCFADGSTNIPLRRPDGSLVKGMAGSLSPAADSSGEVREHLSPDGSHFVFGSEAKFEAAGASGETTIYDRNLVTGVSQVASTLPNGATLSGDVAQLDISENGHRILIGRVVGTDSAGNRSYDLFMHVGNSPSSLLVADTPNGVVYNGMTSDGTVVYFTTSDSLGGDADNSPDLYRAEIAGTSVGITRVSTGIGGAGNSDACTPTADWNKVAGGPDCATVAFAGGAGVAKQDGAIYFLSPELLDGPENGEIDEPNLYFADSSEPPQFVTTLEPTSLAVANGVENTEQHSYGDFQVTPSGRFAAFASSLSLTGFPNFGHSEVFRFDAEAEELDCPSCAPSFTAPTSDTGLPPFGSALTNDGRVFFTSSEALVLRDSNGKQDAYQWTNGSVQLVSLGTGPEDSALLSVSTDGKNAFFFTRDTLVSEDLNGSAVKLYTARETGGYVYDPPLLPCAASDECHGPGSQPPPPPDINTVTGEGATESSGSDLKCNRLQAKVRASSRRAAKLRRRAGRASSKTKAVVLRRRARRAAATARRVQKSARSCFRTRRGRQ